MNSGPAGSRGEPRPGIESPFCELFRRELAVGLIDFDFAGPNDPPRDLAIAVQHWVPLADPADLLDPPSGWSATSRLAAMLDAYSLSDASMARLLDLVDAYLEQGRLGVLARVEAGQERFIAYWNAGFGDRLQPRSGLVAITTSRTGLGLRSNSSNGIESEATTLAVAWK